LIVTRYRQHIPSEIKDQQLCKLWRSVTNDNRIPVEDIKHGKELILAITYMLHVLKFGITVPECEWSMREPWRIGSGRLALLRMYDKWIGCHCNTNCGRRWNFAGDLGMSITEDNSLSQCPIVELIKGDEKKFRSFREKLSDMRTEWRTPRRDV